MDGDKNLEGRLFAAMGEAVGKIAAEAMPKGELDDAVYLQVVRKQSRVVSAAVVAAAGRISRAFMVAMGLVRDGATRELNSNGAFQDGDN